MRKKMMALMMLNLTCFQLSINLKFFFAEGIGNNAVKFDNFEVVMYLSKLIFSAIWPCSAGTFNNKAHSHWQLWPIDRLFATMLLSLAWCQTINIHRNHGIALNYWWQTCRVEERKWFPAISRLKDGASLKYEKKDLPLSTRFCKGKEGRNVS